MKMANNWLRLQLFSAEGEGAAGQTGDNTAADAGQHGEQVSANRAKTQDAAAPETPAPGRLTWQEIVNDPEYNREIRSIISSRLREEKKAGSEVPRAELQEGFHRHIQSLEQQGEQLKKVFPGFDLRRELSNPAFARMTAPDVGISVEDAYYALHRGEIQSAAMQVTAQKTAQMISGSIRASQLRPRENGATGQGTSISAFDYRGASPEQRTALKKRIREAAFRGEKLYPGYN